MYETKSLWMIDVHRFRTHSLRQTPSSNVLQPDTQCTHESARFPLVNMLQVPIIYAIHIKPQPAQSGSQHDFLNHPLLLTHVVSCAYPIPFLRTVHTFEIF